VDTEEGFGSSWVNRKKKKKSPHRGQFGGTCNPTHSRKGFLQDQTTGIKGARARIAEGRPRGPRKWEKSEADCPIRGWDWKSHHGAREEERGIGE